MTPDEQGQSLPSSIVGVLGCSRFNEATDYRLA